MGKRKEKKTCQPKGRHDERLQAIYAKSRAEFSAADLQKFTEVEEGVPFEKILGGLEEIHRKSKKNKTACEP
jgi:hypothetical protein